MTGPPAPCALSLPTSSWSKKAIERTACSDDRASGAATESMRACGRREEREATRQEHKAGSSAIAHPMRHTQRSIHPDTLLEKLGI
jgi:hypothetical protein